MPLNKTLAAMFAAAAITVAPLGIMPALAQQAPESTTLSEAELDAFVVALKDVVAIEQEYGARLQNAGSEAEQQEVISQAQAEILEAVEETPGIEIDRYVEILTMAQNDPELQEQLNKRLQN